VVGRCLARPYGVGVSRASWYGVYPFVRGVNINGGLSSLVDVCVCVCERGALVVSVGRKHECVPACCIMRYKLHEFIIIDVEYIYGFV